MQGPSILDFSRFSRLLSLLVLLAVASACSRSPTEQALRNQLDAMQEAAEQREMGEFMDGVADDFVGNSSEFDREGLQRLLRVIALRHQSIGVTRMALDVEMHGDRAVVRMQILVTGGSGGLIPDQGQLFDTESAWRFVDGEWQLGSAQWKPVR
ncbi:MAG: nuclear transport factor 2 family protein [Lysobacterales bacterium]|nr:nuclear transport factor 2 family protein [Xanthomonadales bacterium]MCP5475124.1 nuclear transport factor 2 family protein [Rhodanobacteraceae bacterium]